MSLEEFAETFVPILASEHGRPLMYWDQLPDLYADNLPAARVRVCYKRMARMGMFEPTTFVEELSRPLPPPRPKPDILFRQLPLFDSCTGS
jgi:hypothetical protein